MQASIAIIDYQMGNLRSVQKALEFIGFQATITSDPIEISRCEKVILPGVGGFPDAIREIKSRRLDKSILESIQLGKPFLGICLGLQLLFEVGFEGGRHEGLGILPGSVVRFTGLPFSTDPPLKIPHIGWNQVSEKTAGCPLFRDIPANEYFYFVHSYYVEPADSNDRWLETDYGTSFCSAIWRDNIFATQFHPEKSQSAGLQLLKNFAEL